MDFSRPIYTKLKGNLIPFALFTCSLFYLGYVAYFLDHSLDFTDEGFYINWISNPFSFNATSTIFGFALHPIYNLLNRDIYFLRLLVVLCQATLAFFIFYLYLRDLFSSTFERLSYSLALSSIAFMAIRNWLLTPSYNSLAIIGILGYFLTTLIIKKYRPHTLVASFLIALSGVITFCGKPTAAAFLALHCVFFLFSSFKDKKALLFHFLLSGSIALSLLVAIAYYSANSITGFFSLFKNGLELGALMESGHGISKMFRFDRVPLFKKPVLVFFYYLLLAFLAFRHSFQRRFNYYLGAAFLPLLVLSIWSFIPDQLELLQKIVPGLNAERMPVLYLSMAFFTLAFYVMQFFLVNRFSKEVFYASCKIFAKPFLLCYFFVYAFSFGTGNNYWLHGYALAIFFILPLISIIDSKNLTYPIEQKRKLIQSLAFIVLATSALIVNTGMATPYRQQGDSRSFTNLVQINNSSFYVSADSADYIHKLRELDKEHKLSQKQGFLDLSGFHPLIAYVTGSKPLGAPWILGSYKGSNAVAEKVFSMIPPSELTDFWVLTENDDFISISHDTLNSIGLDLETDFELIHTLSGYREEFVQRIYVLKPISP